MMWDAILQALTPYLLVITLAGVSLGIVWGAMPGLSTTMAMALLIGLSAGMEQNTALSFMLGVYTGSVFGGAISAVMLNIPGTPDAVPTMIEGHQLALRGEGGQALGMAIAASFIGNWVGIVLLVGFIPLILTFALNFRSWEMFLLAMIGISICGSMAAGSLPLKGWITGWIGILVKRRSSCLHVAGFLASVGSCRSRFALLGFLVGFGHGQVVERGRIKFGKQGERNFCLEEIKL